TWGRAGRPPRPCRDPRWCSLGGFVWTAAGRLRPTRRLQYQHCTRGRQDAAGWSVDTRHGGCSPGGRDTRMVFFGFVLAFMLFCHFKKQLRRARREALRDHGYARADDWSASWRKQCADWNHQWAEQAERYGDKHAEWHRKWAKRMERHTERDQRR